MPLLYQKYITRQNLRENPDIYYVFGDNVKRSGFGGQAKEMRGESNAIGIVTKWKPSNHPSSFFCDTDYARIISILDEDLEKVFNHLKSGKNVVWPLDGIGTGLSKLPQEAPRVWGYLENVRKSIFEPYTLN